ncbi:FimV family protein [Phytopseudomonas dryadis]|uniref:FimV family protein n=1 Tax=Phytopseudomonas dryadis TaxID=2487520 RepID=UPI001A955DE0|nr:FimV family protein [Pseudomonas dryadis]
MTRVRRLLIGLASGSAFYSGLAPALGLGEITLHSALNQPLDAEIELLAVGDLSADDLKVRLASADAFQRSGVDRVHFLSDLRFTPLLRGGNSAIRVVSSQPVREPFLNFIVEVSRPNGQLLREYTLLLDPPGSSAYRALAAVPAVRGEDRPSPAARAPAAAPRPTPAATQGQRYTVASGDSLWTIASRLRGHGSPATQQELMRDIHALNPQAFGNGDIHRLRAGASLLLPDSAVPVSSPAALAATPAAEPMSAAASDSTPQQPQEPQVELLAQMRRVDEELASRTAENLQLQQNMLAMQEQLQALQQQMQARDAQLAQLQAQIAARTPAQPVVTSAAAATRGMWWLLVVSLLAVLGALLALFWRSRRRDARAVVEPAVIMPPPAEAVVVTRAEAPVPARPQGLEPASLVGATDALEGANIYIAYGRLGEAATTLRQACLAQPQRGDIRLRLLDVLAQQGNAEAFAEEEAVLRESGFDPARIDQLKARYPALFAQPAPEPLDDLILAFDETPAPAAQPPQDDDFQLNLDDLSLDADWDLVSPFAPDANRKAAVQAELDSQLDELPEAFFPDARSPFASAMLVEEGLPDDLDRLAADHESLSQLNLALAYIEQGDLQAACAILNEVIDEGDEQQKQEARELLARIA